MEITLFVTHLKFSTLKLQEQLNKVREEKTELELQLEKEVDRFKKVIYSLHMTYRLHFLMDAKKA